jgi:plasmid replication initiation protein
MTTNPRPESERQPDLFAASFADIPIRDQRDTMERPFFSLAKKPRVEPIQYQVGNVWVEVSANPQFGMATIWDADILIWASTQITEAMDRQFTPSRTIHFHPYNLLRAIRRTTGGADYTRLRAALERLTHTAVRTNIRAQGKKKFASFHWLESWTETIDEATGEPTGMTITLPDWLYDGVIDRGGVLTIHEDYFIRHVVQANKLPEYELSMTRNGEGDEIVHFVHRKYLALDHPRREYPRFPGRRKSQGIFSQAWKLNTFLDEDSGD